MDADTQAQVLEERPQGFAAIRLVALFVITVWLVWLLVAALPTAIFWNIWGGLGLGFGAIPLLILWGKNMLFEVGAGAQPATAVLLRWGRAYTAVGPGLYPEFPQEKLVVFPTGLYEPEFPPVNILSREVRTDEGVVLGSQRMEVQVTLHFRFPGPDVRETFFFPVVHNSSLFQEALGAQEEDQENLLLASWAWKPALAGTLLMAAYYGLPHNPGQVTVQDYINLFDSAVKGAVTGVLGQLDHVTIRRDTRRVAALVELWMLTDEGGSIHAAQLPASRLEVVITDLHFTKETEQAMMAEENAQRQARGVVQAARGRREAARLDVQTLRDYIQAGVPGDIAALVIEGLQAGQMSPGDLQSFAMTRLLLSSGQQNVSPEGMRWLAALSLGTIQQLPRLPSPRIVESGKD